MIKVIIFDIGNVLAPFAWEDCLRDHGYSEDMAVRIGKATVNHPLWKEMDRSATLEEELIVRFIRNDPDIAAEIWEFLLFSDTAVREFDYSAGLISALKEKGYKVYLLSNYGGRNYQYAMDHFAFIKLADGAVISYEVGSVKPEPEIFEALIRKYNLNPQEAVFLDDLETNVEAATAHGFHTIRFNNLNQALEDLRAMNIII